jgi:hypothetical protein
MHKCQIIENNNKNLTGQNVIPNGQNVIPSGENVTPKQFMCKKCNKIYNSKRYLKENEKKCIGVDDLTCPRCMISFDV